MTGSAAAGFPGSPLVGALGGEGERLADLRLVDVDVEIAFDGARLFGRVRDGELGIGRLVDVGGRGEELGGPV